MKEGILIDSDREFDDPDESAGGLTSSAAFPVLVGLWFAALFGAGCLFLPSVLFDMAFGGESPLGAQTRIVAALVAAVIGLALGLFIASKVRTEPKRDVAPPPPRKRKRDTRPPLDVRAALGLPSDDEDDEDDLEAALDDDDRFDDDVDLADAPEHDAFELADEYKPPIDDPYFASAWSDAGQHDSHPPQDADDWEADDAAPDQAQDIPPTRYNPFADFVKPDEEEEPARPAFEQPREDHSRAPEPCDDAWRAEPADAAWKPEPFAMPQPARPAVPPPPPAWPLPRSEEPALGELGVAELVERLARALQGQERDQPRAQACQCPISHEPSHDAPYVRSTPTAPDIDRALRGALDRLSRLDDVA